MNKTSFSKYSLKTRPKMRVMLKNRSNLKEEAITHHNSAVIHYEKSVSTSSLRNSSIQ